MALTFEPKDDYVASKLQDVQSVLKYKNYFVRRYLALCKSVRWNCFIQSFHKGSRAIWWEPHVIDQIAMFDHIWLSASLWPSSVINGHAKIPSRRFLAIKDGHQRTSCRQLRFWVFAIYQNPMKSTGYYYIMFCRSYLGVGRPSGFLSGTGW